MCNRRAAAAIPPASTAATNAVSCRSSTYNRLGRWQTNGIGMLLFTTPLLMSTP
jgi:hypothetical protein